MKNFLVIIFIIIVSHKNYAQKKISAEILTGVGFNKSLTLVNERIENYSTYTTQVNVNYRFSLYKKLLAETGLGA